MTVLATTATERRPRVRGRSVLVGGEKFHVRGVTYGTFRLTDGSPFPGPMRVREDFAAMAAAGINSVRTYVPPPIWLLDMALEHGIHVMVGLAWEQHIAFLDDPGRARRIAQGLAEQVGACAGHPAILCYAIGNEIPAPIVRWHGKRPVEQFLERLYREAKSADPDGLVTYVNYPSTEYLELPFLDLAAFNVFLERERTFESYLARLQNLSGDRPLLITELGIDSQRHGVEAQAETLEWQIHHAFATGAAGAFVFAWTDEWHRGGYEVLDWDFGLVDRDREPKPALSAVSRAFAGVPFTASEGPWPSVSVVVCTHNGQRTLAECLQRLGELTYPDYEVIVVNDGSSRACAEIARAHGAILLQTEHRGLSHARNKGIEAARGKIVAFLDDDAYPDADWLHYIAAQLRANGHAGVGGPNVPPEDDGFIAECVAAAPGGPIHVLVSDREAEHVPGCNMAFRKDVLEEVGCFDERFLAAGDDVDVCWRLQKAGQTLGFSAGAVVMHRRRDSIRRYLRQQYGYGKAEGLLERKWPTHYNRAGSSRWAGRIYETPPQTPRRRAMVRYGTWGSGLFQSIYTPPRAFSGILQAPEGLLVVALLGALSILGLLFQPLLFVAPFFLAAIAWLMAAAVSNGWRAHHPIPERGRGETLKRRAVTALLFGLQPLVRLAGRLRNGLSPWRRRVPAAAALPLPRTVQVWSECWRDQQAWLEQLQDGLAAAGGFVRSGGPFDRWDLDLRAGPLGGVKIRTVIEEHGDGQQLLRAKVWPRTTATGPLAVLALVLLAIVALHQHRPEVLFATVAAIALLLAIGAEGTATATSLALEQLEELGRRDDESTPTGVVEGELLTLAVQPTAVGDEPSWRFGAAALHDSGEVRR